MSKTSTNIGAPLNAAIKVRGIEANHIHPNSRNRAYLVSPPLLKIPIITNVLKDLRAISIPMIKNILVISEAKLSETLNIFNNNGIFKIKIIPSIKPAENTSIENFLAYSMALLIWSAPSSFPSIIDAPDAIHTAVIMKKLPVLVAIWLAAIAEVPALAYATEYRTVPIAHTESFTNIGKLFDEKDFIKFYQ